MPRHLSLVVQETGGGIARSGQADHGPPSPITLPPPSHEKGQLLVTDAIRIAVDLEIVELQKAQIDPIRQVILTPVSLPG